jgi:hypothetical protein
MPTHAGNGLSIRICADSTRPPLARPPPGAGRAGRPMAALSPAESLFLLKPNRTPARETVKVTLLSLLAQGIVRLEEQVTKRFIGTRKTVYVRLTQRPVPALAPPVRPRAMLRPALHLPRLRLLRQRSPTMPRPRRAQAMLRPAPRLPRLCPAPRPRSPTTLRPRPPQAMLSPSPTTPGPPPPQGILRPAPRLPRLRQQAIKSLASVLRRLPLRAAPSW